MRGQPRAAHAPAPSGMRCGGQLLLPLLFALLPASGGWFDGLTQRDGHGDRVDADCPGAAHCGDDEQLLSAHIEEIRSYGGDSIHEHVLQSFDRDGDHAVSLAEARARGLGAVHFAYYDTSPTNQKLDYDEWIRCARELPQYAAADLTAPPPPGHMRPLGQHGTPAALGELADLLEFAPGAAPPHPRDFWREQVAKHRPALLRGAGRFSVAASRWSESYLLEHHGDIAVKVEPAKEARASQTVYDRLHAHVPHNGRMTLRELLQLPLEAAAYAVTILPQAMAW
jgi:hypothetical protein